MSSNTQHIDRSVDYCAYRTATFKYQTCNNFQTGLTKNIRIKSFEQIELIFFYWIKLNLKQLLNTDICRVPRSFSLANNKEKLLVKVINSPLLKNKRIVLLNTGINHTEVFQVIWSLNFCQALSATGSDFCSLTSVPTTAKGKMVTTVLFRTNN